MPFRFFRRIPLVGRFVTVNVSKGGVSASVGVPGFHVTTGPRGSQITAGLPGTGLFYTEQLGRLSQAGGRREKLQQLIERYRPLGDPAAPASDFVAAIQAQEQLGLRDDELPPALVEMRAHVIDTLQSRFGYRVVRREPPPPPAATKANLALPLFLLAIVVGGALLAIWALLR